MKVELSKKEIEKIAKKTKLFKFKILSEMIDWKSDINYLKELVKEAEKEYNDLRAFAGSKYPLGKCKNILELFKFLHDFVDKEIKRLEKGVKIKDE